MVSGVRTMGFELLFWFPYSFDILNFMEVMNDKKDK
jgi:hypothetical protein